MTVVVKFFVELSEKRFTIGSQFKKIEETDTILIKTCKLVDRQVSGIFGASSTLSGSNKRSATGKCEVKLSHRQLYLHGYKIPLGL